MKINFYNASLAVGSKKKKFGQKLVLLMPCLVNMDYWIKTVEYHFLPSKSWNHGLVGASELVSDATVFRLLETGISWLCFPSYVVTKALGSSDALSTCLRTLHL